MSKSKLSDIFLENNLIEINISDLQCVNIYPDDTTTVKLLVKTLRKKYIKHFIYCSPFSLIFLFIIYDTMKNSTSIFTFDFLCTVCISSMYLLVLLYISSQINTFKTSTYKKAQYGILKSKYYFTTSTENNFIKNYYANIEFKYNSTYIRNVICTEDIYEKLSVGDNVLVISFNNKQAYAIISRHLS